jgi:hypothetical protein
VKLLSAVCPTTGDSSTAVSECGSFISNSQQRNLWQHYVGAAAFSRVQRTFC